MRHAAVLLLVACGLGLPVAAQDKAAPAQPPERSARDRPTLNLRLDNPSSWATVAPEPEKEPRQALPGLGADARPLPQTPAPPVPTSNSSSSPYPKDTAPGR